MTDEKARNLICRVGPENTSGAFRRTFCLVTRFPGSKNPTRHAFGEYKVNGKGDLTVEEARDLAAEWRALIRKNIDPREAARLIAQIQSASPARQATSRLPSFASA